MSKMKTLMIVFFISLALSAVMYSTNALAQVTTVPAKTPPAAAPAPSPSAQIAAADQVLEKEPSPELLKRLAREYIEEKSQYRTTMDIEDPEANQTRKLLFNSMKDISGKFTFKNRSLYYVRAEFQDVRTNDRVFVDIDIDDIDGLLSVVEVNIQQVNDTPRYVYDEKNVRVPVSSVTIPNEP